MAKISFYDIASVLVEHNGLTQSKANDFVKTMFDIIQERLRIDQQVKVKGLGTFKIIAVEDRESINVNTGERILIEGHSKITFTPDTAMKELINRPFSQFETVIINEGVKLKKRSAVAQENKDVIDTTEEDELNVFLDTIAEPVGAVLDEYVLDGEEFMFVGEDEILVEEKKSAKIEVEANVSEDTIINEETLTDKEVAVPVVQEVETAVLEEEPLVIEDLPVTETTPEEETVVVSEPVEETIIAPDPVEEITTASEPIVEVSEPAVEEQKETEFEQEETEFETAEETEDDEEAPSRMKSVLLHILYTIVIAGLSAYAGYWYGVNYASKSADVNDVAKNIAEPKAVKSAKKIAPVDTIKKDTLKKSVTTNNATVTDKQPIQAAQPLTGAQSVRTDSAAFDHKKYAAMDVRVRTGAYLIVGEDRTVTARKGETLLKLSKRVLGEGMECYVEVFNGISAKTELQEGQKIKIPKLQLKKKKTNTPQP